MRFWSSVIVLGLSVLLIFLIGTTQSTISENLDRKQISRTILGNPGQFGHSAGGLNFKLARVSFRMGALPPLEIILLKFIIDVDKC